MKNAAHRHLSMPKLFRLVCDEIERIPDPVDSRGLTLGDRLASGLAVYLLRFPSLPQFDTEARRGGNPAAARRATATGCSPEPRRIRTARSSLPSRQR
ncbi:MAG: hypothetical protein OXI01_15325 [Albidovulum sp.]|nr:hypothetical protein [Albidovulum sp.]